MTKPNDPKKPGCGERKTAKGTTFYVSATWPAGKKLVRQLTKTVKKELGLK